jgi:hypothetical protein
MTTSILASQEILVDRVNRKVKVEVTKKEPQDNFPDAHAEVEIAVVDVCQIRSMLAAAVQKTHQPIARIVECKYRFIVTNQSINGFTLVTVTDLRHQNYHIINPNSAS